MLDKTPKKQPGLLEGQHAGGASKLPGDAGGFAMSVKISRDHVIFHFGDRPVHWFALTSVEATELSDLLKKLADQLRATGN